VSELPFVSIANDSDKGPTDSITEGEDDESEFLLPSCDFVVNP
jgi:hypothetical protein